MQYLSYFPHTCKWDKLVKMNMKLINQVEMRELMSKNCSVLHSPKANCNVSRPYTRIHWEQTKLEQT